MQPILSIIPEACFSLRGGKLEPFFLKYDISALDIQSKAFKCIVDKEEVKFIDAFDTSKKEFIDEDTFFKVLFPGIDFQIQNEAERS